MIYPIICIVCYFTAELIKKTKLPKEILPLICMLLGTLLGAIATAVFPEIAASEALDSDTAEKLLKLWGFSVSASGAAIPIPLGGAISGLAATGSNQAVKQALKLFDSLKNNKNS